MCGRDTCALFKIRSIVSEGFLLVAASNIPFTGAAQKRTLLYCCTDLVADHSSRIRRESRSASITSLGPFISPSLPPSVLLSSLALSDGYNRVGLRNALSDCRRSLGGEPPSSRPMPRASRHIAHPLHLTWPPPPCPPHRPDNPLGLFQPLAFPLTRPPSSFFVILPSLLSHRIGQRRPFREGHQSRLSICNGDSLCPSRVGPDSPPYTFPPSTPHASAISLSLAPFSSRATPYTTNPA